MKRRFCTLVAAAAMAIGSLSGAATTAAAAPHVDHTPAIKPSKCRQLNPRLEWYPGVRERLQQVIDTYGTCAKHPRQAPKVAIFDWDNTVVKNDINDATLYWMLREGRLLAPPRLDWKTTSPYLTDAASTALSAACRPGARPGRTLPTNANAACADEILAVLGGKTRAGETAFDGFDRRRVSATSLWSHSLASGYTNRELVRFARQAMKENLKAPVGSHQMVGTTSVDGYIRVYPQMKDLIKTLKANHIEPWILSGSPEPIVELWASEVGIGKRHAIGSRAILDNRGRRTHHESGCGGSAQDQAVPSIDGKRCWANQEIFGVRGPRAWQQLPARHRQIFGAGDANSDLTFTADATAARLIINRNQTELMCRAYDNADGKWLINPMFIEPKPQLAKPYPCSTTGYTNSDGESGPLVRSNGTIVPDQIDSVFG